MIKRTFKKQSEQTNNNSDARESRRAREVRAEPPEAAVRLRDSPDTFPSRGRSRSYTAVPGLTAPTSSTAHAPEHNFEKTRSQRNARLWSDNIFPCNIPWESWAWIANKWRSVAQKGTSFAKLSDLKLQFVKIWPYACFENRTCLVPLKTLNYLACHFQDMSCMNAYTPRTIRKNSCV